MKFSFDPEDGLIVVLVRLWGPGGDLGVPLALDTGATFSMVGSGIMRLLGFEPQRAAEHVRIVTASSVELVPRIATAKPEALGRACANFPVLCHTLPPTATVDGVLGLDFFRGLQLTIDFRSGVLAVE